MPAHSSFLSWEIPWTKALGGLWFKNTTEHTHTQEIETLQLFRSHVSTHIYTSKIIELKFKCNKK